MVDGRKTRVALIDDRQLDIIVQPRLTVDELLNIVASHCCLKDPDKQYFGLAFQDDKQQLYWLQNERRVLDHEFPKKFCMPGATLILYHLIRLFVDSITHLAHPSTAELFFLHASSQIHKGLIIADNEQIIKLASFMAQIYYGDFIDHSTALNNLKRLPIFPAKILKEYASISICEEKVLTLYKSLIGTSRGHALVGYMEIVERVPTYGIHFFEVKDKLGNDHDLGISRMGIYQYNAGDKTKPVKGFQWRQLENLYYRDKKFSMEIHECRRVVHTASSFSIYDEMNHNSFDEGDDLMAAVRDPTTQVSSSRRAFLPSHVTVQIYFCDTPQLCKSIWSLTIVQHQFYLDRRAAHKKGISLMHHTPDHLAKLLNANFNLIKFNTKPEIGFCRLDSSDRSTSDLGLSISSQSAQSIPVGYSSVHERTEEDKFSCKEKSRQLKLKRGEIEKLLAEKIVELKEICITEGNLIGRLPSEIKQCLAPGEVVPKVQRRVGTSFCIPLDVMSKNSKTDQIDKLEADLEIQRKIVTAALKLANDSSANKFMRKKRRREYESAQTRLKELNQLLNRLRLGSSRPDLSTRNESSSQLSKHHQKSFRPTKSAPTTPRSSIPDLSIDICDLTSSPSSFNRCYGTTIATSSSPKKVAAQLDTIEKPMKRHIVDETNTRRDMSINDPTACNQRISSHVSIDEKATSCNGIDILEALDDFTSDLKISEKTASSGYHSQVSYNSTYRRRNYPTLNDNSKPLFYTGNRSPSLNNRHNNGELPPPIGAPKPSNMSQNCMNQKQSCIPHVALDHRVGAYNLPNQRTSWDYDCISQAPLSFGALLSSSESLDGRALHNAKINSRLIRPTTKTNSKINVDRCGISDGFSSPRFTRPNFSYHCYTASLDRRALKDRLKEHSVKQAAMNQASSYSHANSSDIDQNLRLLLQSQSSCLRDLDRSPPKYGARQLSSKSLTNTSTSSVKEIRMPSNASSPCMDFNVNLKNDQHSIAKACGGANHRKLSVNHSPVAFTKACNDLYPQNNNTHSGALSPKVVELSKPYETSDVLKYSERGRQHLLDNNNAFDNINAYNDGKNIIYRQNGSADLLLWFEEKRKRSQNSSTIV